MRNTKIIIALWVIAAALVIWVLSEINYSPIGFAEEKDETPPQLVKVEVQEVTSSSATILWKTDEPSDSILNYGTKKDAGTIRDFIASSTHLIVIDELEPVTTYYFQVRSHDSSGNQSISGGYSFITKGGKPLPGLEKIVSAGERRVIEKIAALLERLTEEEALKLLAQKIQERGKEELQPPKIIGDPNVMPSEDSALISWATDKPSNSIVEFASESEYDPQKENPYVSQQGIFEESVLDHKVNVVGLRPSTLYHFRVVSKPEIGPIGMSEDKTFKTKAVLPAISNIKLLKVEETSATITFNTNIPTTAFVEYTNLRTRQSKIEGSLLFLNSHVIKLSDLSFNTPYRAVIRVENAEGDKAVSDPINFTTTRDAFPPIISKVNNESTLYPGAEIKIQTIISWETDEPAVCGLFYHPGLAPSKDIVSLEAESNPTVKHVEVITNFQPATVYKFWIECRDPAENKSRSEDFVLLTPQKEKSIIDIIIENFEGTFGWVKNITRRK